MPHLSHRFGASLATLLVLLGALGAFAPLAMAQAPSPTPPGGAPGGQSQTAEYKPDALDSTVGWLMNKIASLFAWLLGVAAITLDYVVFYTVIKMGDFVSRVQGVENIGIAWRVLRDIGNIALIFGFLASGIMVILNASYFGFGSKMLPGLLVAAVFINFSLFISEAVIDVGNIFATQIYTQINNGRVPTPASMQGDFFTSVSSEGISNRIMSVLGLAGIYQTSSAGGDTIKGSALGGSGPWYLGFMAILLFITAAFVFFSLAFILVARFVALIFLIIIAPLGFAGLAIPQLSGLAKQWWSHLIEQTLTAPVLLLLLYIALAVITDAKFLLRAGGWTTSTTDAGSAWQGFLNTGAGGLAQFGSILMAFIIAMGLLLAVIVTAKRMSAFGATGAMKLAGGMMAYGMSAPVNAAGWLGRKGVQKYAPNSKAAQRATRWLFRPMQNARMDIRSAGLGYAMKAAGAGEAAAAVAKSPGGRIQQGYQYWQKSGQEAERTFQRESAMPRLQAAAAAGDTRAMATIVGGFSDKELESPEVRRALRTPAAAAALSQSKFDKLMDSDQVSDADKAVIRKARGDGITARYTDTVEYRNPPTHPTAPGAAIPSITHPGTNMSRGEQAIRALKNEEISKLPDTTLLSTDNTGMHMYEQLTLRQLNAIYRAGSIDSTTAHTIGAWVNVHHADFPTYVAGLPAGQQVEVRRFWGI